MVMVYMCMCLCFVHHLIFLFTDLLSKNIHGPRIHIEDIIVNTIIKIFNVFSAF